MTVFRERSTMSLAEDRYEAHAEQMMWAPSEGLHIWIAARVLRAFVAQSGIQPEGSSLLEVGTGSGRIARAAVAQGWKYEGVEPTRVFAEATRAVDSSIVIHDAALPDLPTELADNFDAVLTMHVMEHAASPAEARAWAWALATCLNRGGSMLVVAPDVRDYRSGFWDADWSHGWPTTPARVSQLLEEVGLEVTKSTTMRAGSLSPWSSMAILGELIPTRAVDAATRRLTGRPLGTGMKIGFLWGMTFVIARRV